MDERTGWSERPLDGHHADTQRDDAVPAAPPADGTAPSTAAADDAADAATGAADAADAAAQRRRAAAGRAAALDADRAAEATRAAALLTDFVRRAGERGLAPGPLRARGMTGTATYRTRVRGWYLRRDRTVAVGEDAGYYVLTVPGSLRERVTGADVRPSAPRLVVGAGGGDGETVPLAELLERRLGAGVRWP